MGKVEVSHSRDELLFFLNQSTSLLTVAKEEAELG